MPPYKAVSYDKMIQGARGNDPKRFFNLHHPRLPKGIGYFNVIGFSPKTPRANLRGHFDYDGIEVFNGFDVEQIPRVEQVLADWYALLNHGYRQVATGSSDAHRIQYQWAGYPRTMVALEGTDQIDEKFDPMNVVAAIKKGHSTVTSGPIIELELTDGSKTAHPGDELFTEADPIQGRVKVRAAPWVDVTQVQIVLNGKVVQTLSVESRPTKIGKEGIEGTLEEAQAKTLRFDRPISNPHRFRERLGARRRARYAEDGRRPSFHEGGSLWLHEPRVDHTALREAAAAGHDGCSDVGCGTTPSGVVQVIPRLCGGPPHNLVCFPGFALARPNARGAVPRPRGSGFRMMMLDAKGGNRT